MNSQKQLKIIAIDPGETTGIAVLDGFWPGNASRFVNENLVSTIHLHSPNEGAEYKNASDIVELIDNLMPSPTLPARQSWVQDGFIVVIEDFILYGGSHSSDRSGLSPVRMTAMIRALMYERNISEGVEIAYQMASMIKTDIVKRQMRVLKPEAGVLIPHGRDALSHALVWLKSHEKALDHSFLADS